MRVQPRQELVAIWKAIAKWLASAESWNWEGRDGRNCISDAELLLCLLLPERRLDDIRFDLPDRTKADVLDALAPLGTAVEIPRRLVRLIAEYLERYADPATGVPVFSGGSYFASTDPEGGRAPTARQRTLDVVDAYSTSVVLTIAALEFLQRYRSEVQRKSHLDEIEAVERAARRRLTAAMVGLRRSFTVSVFRHDSREGRILCRTVSQRDDPGPTVVEALRYELRDVTYGLRELMPGSESIVDLLENPDLLFECGWSWGVVRDAPAVETDALGRFDSPGIAEPAPYLYFTVVSVDAIRELFSERTRARGLLDDEQQLLARTLNLQLDVARRYWSTVASFGDSWPLADIPWRTTDGDETDYYSLLVADLVLENLVVRRAPDTDLERIASVLEDLGARSRVARRPLVNDPALALHDPGRRIDLVGSEDVGDDAPRLGWLLADVATLLLGRTLGVARQVNDPRLRARLLELADVTWHHLEQRRIAGGEAAGLWDHLTGAFPELRPPAEAPAAEEAPSWYLTTRVAQCLSTAAGLVRGEPPVGELLPQMAVELLAEAEHLFDGEMLRGSGAGGPALRDSLREQSTSLRRARTILRSRPGTAVARICEVLRELDKLAATRESEPGA